MLVEDAREQFRYARQNSIEAFTTAVNFDGKLLATKIRLLSLFHLEGYFTSPETVNIPYLENLCKQALMPLFESAEVQSAIAYRDGGLFGFGKKEGRRVLAEISALRHTVTTHLSPVTKFPLLTSAREELKLHDVVLKEISCVYNCTATSGDKLYVGTNGPICVWELISFTELPALHGHGDVVNCMVATGDRLYSSSRDHTIRVSDLNTQKPLGCLYESATCIAVSGSMLYSGGDSGFIRKWDTLTFSHELSMQCSNHVCRLAVSSSKLYSRCLDEYYVRVWDLDTLWADDTKLRGHTDTTTSIAVSGNWVITGSGDYTIRVWKGTGIECLHGHTNAIKCLVVSGRRLYSGGDDKTIRVWDLDSLIEIDCISTASEVKKLHISAGKLVAALHRTIAVRLV